MPRTSGPIGFEEYKSALALVRRLLPGDGRWYKAGKSSTRQWLFRGHGDADWKLRPSVFRRPLPNGDDARKSGPRTRHQVLFYEAIALRDFIVEADRVGLHVPGSSEVLRDRRSVQTALWDPFNEAEVNRALWPPDHLLEAFALAQHYQLPTRLLDWSQSPLVAAYFAASSAIDEVAKAQQEGRAPPTKLSVWCINVQFYWRIFDNSPRFVIVRTPRSVNPNMRAQSGGFTLDRDPGPHSYGPYEPPTLDEAVQNAYESAQRHVRRNIRDYSPGLIKLTLPIKAAPELLRLVDEHGISASVMYPGFASVVRTLYDRVPLVLPSYVPAFRGLAAK